MNPKNSISHFVHFADMHRREELAGLRAALGMEGYGTYMALLELLLSSPDCMLAANYRRLASILGVSVDVLRSVVEDFNLFQFSEDEKSFFSSELQREVQKANARKSRRSKAGKLGAVRRWKAGGEEAPNDGNAKDADGNAGISDDNAMMNDGNAMETDGNAMSAPAGKKEKKESFPDPSKKQKVRTHTHAPRAGEAEAVGETEGVAALSAALPAAPPVCRPVVPAEAEEFRPYDRWVPELRGSSLWQEQVRLAVFRVCPSPPPGLTPDALLDEFVNLQLMGGRVERDFGDFRHHFSRWLNIKLEKYRTTTSTTLKPAPHNENPQKRPDKRTANENAVRELNRRAEERGGTAAQELPDIY